MTLARRSPLLAPLVLLALAGTPAAALAQDAPAAPASTINPEQAAKARTLLDRAAKAVAELKTISYSLRTEAGNHPARRVANVFRVTLARGADQGWRAIVKSQEAPDTTPLTPVHVAFDGTTGRAVDVVNRLVHEGNFKTLDEAQTFLAKFRARPAILWDVFGAEPFKNALAASMMTVEDSAEVNGLKCDVVRIELGGTDRKPSMDEGNLPGYRFYISSEDHLIRRIERLPASKAAGEFDDFAKPARTLTLSDIEVDKTIADDAFTVATPTGYSVKLPDGSIKGATTGNTPTPTQALESGDPKLLAVGSEPPPWGINDSEGKFFNLVDQKGKIVLMDFWATWCGPCKASMPGLQRLHEKYKDRGLEVVGLAVWERGDPKAYMDDKKFTYRLLPKADQIAEAYRVNGIPTFYVIGPDGKIIYTAVGYDPDHENQIAALVEKYLPAAPVSAPTNPAPTDGAVKPNADPGHPPVKETPSH